MAKNSAQPLANNQLRTEAPQFDKPQGSESQQQPCSLEVVPSPVKPADKNPALVNTLVAALWRAQ